MKSRRYHRSASSPDSSNEFNGVRFSQCAVDYAKALADTRGAEPCCLPIDQIVQPSMKTKVFVRGSMTTSSTTGVGFITVNPMSMAFPAAAPGTGSGVFASSAAYLGSTVAGAGTGVQQLDSNAPFTDAQRGAGIGLVQARVTSVAIYARSTTAALTAAGRALCVTEPNHGNLLAATAVNLTAFDNTCIEAVTPGSEYVVEGGPPVITEEMTFCSTRTAPPAGGWTTTTGCPLVFFVDGAALTPNNDTFSFEVWANVEYIGAPVRGKTGSGTDPVGAPSLISAAQELTVSPTNGKKNRGWTFANLMSRAADIVKKSVTIVMSMPGPRVARIGAELIAPHLLGAGKQLLGVATKNLTRNLMAQAGVSTKKRVKKRGG